MDIESRFHLRIERVDEFEFRVRFDNPAHAEIRMDEPPPIGKDRAPNPARMLAAAVGNCLSASLLFCLGKQRVPVHGFTTEVDVEIVRNEKRRLRVGRVMVKLQPEVDAAQVGFTRCLSMFEDFCTVTESVRSGFPIEVAVEPVVKA